MLFTNFNQYFKENKDDPSFKIYLIYDNIIYLSKLTKDPKKYINIINVIKNLVSLGYNHITTEINSIKIIVSSLPGLYNLNNIGRMKNKYIKEVKKSYNICIPIDCKSKYDDIEGLNENKINFQNDDINNISRYLNITNRCMVYEQLIEDLITIQYVLGTSNNISIKIFEEFKNVEESYGFYLNILRTLEKHIEDETNNIIKEKLEIIDRELFITITGIRNYYQDLIKLKLDDFFDGDIPEIIKLIKNYKKIMNGYKYVPKSLIEIYLLTNFYNLAKENTKQDIFNKINQFFLYIIDINNEIKIMFPFINTERTDINEIDQQNNIVL